MLGGSRPRPSTLLILILMFSPLETVPAFSSRGLGEINRRLCCWRIDHIPSRTPPWKKPIPHCSCRQAELARDTPARVRRRLNGLGDCCQPWPRHLSRYPTYRRRAAGICAHLGIRVVHHPLSASTLQNVLNTTRNPNARLPQVLLGLLDRRSKPTVPNPSSITQDIMLIL